MRKKHKWRKNKEKVKYRKRMWWKKLRTAHRRLVFSLKKKLRTKEKQERREAPKREAIWSTDKKYMRRDRRRL